jgi:thioredoxin reductase (NADPH)
VSERDYENVIIVGSGPAGYTAALYTARANLEPLVAEGFAWGGLLQQTTDVENFPGFPEGIMGPELMTHFRGQAERFGARLETDDAVAVELSRDGGLHTVRIGDDEHFARAVILAMGATHRKLGVPGEEELAGRGVSYCATCDAAFYRDVPTLIVGGGDSAMEEAMFLAKFAAKVVIVHRRDEFRASKIMLERARAVPNIEFLTPYVVEALRPGPEGTLGHAQLRNVLDGSARELEVTGAFVAVGHEPQSQLVAGQLELDAAGYVIT